MDVDPVSTSKPESASEMISNNAGISTSKQPVLIESVEVPGALASQPTKMDAITVDTGRGETPGPSVLPPEDGEKDASRPPRLSDDQLLSILTKRLASTTDSVRQISEMRAETIRLKSQGSIDHDENSLLIRDLRAQVSRTTADRDRRAAEATAALERQQSAEEAEKRATKLVASALRLCKLPKKPTERVYELEKEVSKQRKTIQTKDLEATELQRQLTKAESRIRTLEQKVADGKLTAPAQSDIVQVEK